MYYCLLTLLHFEAVQMGGQDDCSACIRPLSFQGKLRYTFTFYQYLSPVWNMSISECTTGGTVYYKGKLTGLTGSCKNKGTIGQTVCWQKNGDPLKAWNPMTGGGNKPRYVWAPYPSTPPPYQLTKGRVTELEGPPKGDYLGGYEHTEDIDLPPPRSLLRIPPPSPGTGELNLEPQLYNLLNATHRLLNFMNPPLAGDCWLCMSSGPLQYVATMVSLLNQSGHEAPLNSTSTKPRVRNI
jgi:hypothetical protein